MNIWEGGVARQEVPGYCERWGIEGTVLLDETAAYARTLGIRGVPTNVVVDAAGVVTGVGVSTSDELLRAACRLEPRLAEDDAATAPGANHMPRDFAAPPTQ